MQAMQIVCLIFAILAKGAIIVVSVNNLLRKQGYPHIIIIAAMGTMILGDIFCMIPTTATGIIGLIFWLLAWLGLAAGYVLMNLYSWGMMPAKAPAEAPPQQTAG